MLGNGHIIFEIFMSSIHQVHLCQRNRVENVQVQAYLSAIIVYLYAESYEDALACYNNCASYVLNYIIYINICN